MTAFKDIAPGIFRAQNKLCYTKLEKPFKDEEGVVLVNAVCITNGKLRWFEDTDQVDDLKGE